MNERIHSYYQLCFKLTSPMLIGCGKNENTDNDVLLGSDRKPYIPATSIAGVMRRLVSPEEADMVFGCIKTVVKDGQSKTLSVESPVILSDAVTRDKTYITERDNVALDEYKVAKDNLIEGGKAGAKFNYEVVQPGAAFYAIAELTDGNSEIIPIFEDLLAKASAYGMCFGAKTTRGLGAVELTVRKKTFDLNKALDDWLDFDPFDKGAFEGVVPMEFGEYNLDNKLRIELCLEQNGGLSIRYYTGKIGDGNKAEITNSPLLVRADAKEGEAVKGEYISDPATPSESSLPVVPGTSWAGAIRHRFSELVNDDDLANRVFGFVDNAVGKNKAESAIHSKISFSETVIHYGIPKTLTRIAVDRFSGAVKNGALLTEQSVFYGKGDLVITVNRNVEKKALYALIAVLTDLHNGYLAVGGETAIGRGLFKIKEMTINGKAVSPVNFDTMKEVLDACV